MCFDKLKLEGCSILWLLRPRKHDRRGNGHFPWTIHPRTLHPPDNSPSQLGQFPSTNLKITFIHECTHAYIHTYMHSIRAYTHTNIHKLCTRTYIYTYI